MGKTKGPLEIGEYFYMSDRERQISLLKKRVTPAARPNVERAYNIIAGNVKIGQKDQDDKARQILEISSALADRPSPDGPETKKKEAPFSIPESSVLISETLKPMLPLVNEIRRELWGSEKAPFPLNPAKALRWLKKTAAEQNAPTLEKRLEDFPAQSKALNLKIRDLICEFRRLTGYYHRINFVPTNYPSIPVIIAGMDPSKWDGVITFKGTGLAKLAGRAEALSDGRPFMPSAIIRFIMTGIRPFFLFYRMTLQKNHLKTFRVNLELWRPLKKEEMKSLYFEIKDAFGKRDKTFLKEKNQRLYDLVERHGGAPQEDCTAFWTMIMKEWNARNQKAKYTTANGPRIAYKRILSRVQ